MASHRSLHFSHSFAISCGTVTLDPVHDKVLLIYWRTTGEYFLPKGRKDIAETLEQAALRETFEETGYRVELLPLKIQTLATIPDTSNSPGKEEAKEGEGITSVTEPVAVQQRVTKEGTLKIIFWFAAKGNSTDKEEKGIQQEGEDFDTVWTTPENALKIISFDDDRRITEKVLQHGKKE